MKTWLILKWLRWRALIIMGSIIIFLIWQAFFYVELMNSNNARWAEIIIERAEQDRIAKIEAEKKAVKARKEAIERAKLPVEIWKLEIDGKIYVVKKYHPTR